MLSKNISIASTFAALAVFYCVIQTTSTARSNTGESLTFSRDVAPILHKNCAGCHRPNDIAPFSTLTYQDVRPWARSIREKVITREMPPWHADPRYGHFTNDTRLSKKDIDTIVAWVDQGAKEGDPKDLPPLPRYIDGWRIGKPDQVFSMTEEYTIKPDDSDNYVYFVVPTEFKEDRWIQAAEIRPSNKKVVHHVIAHVLTPQAIAGATGSTGQSDRQANGNQEQIFYKEGGLARVKLNAPVIDDGANAPNGGAAFNHRAREEGSDLFSILLTSYAPGKDPDVFAPGMAKRIPAGSKIVLQMHYSSFRGALDKPERDRTSLGVIFAKEPPPNRVVTLTIPNHFFQIPAGAPDHIVTAAYTFDQDVRLIDYMPHMHLRGKQMKYEVVYPDGKRETLLWVPGFNFKWQTLYRLKDPIMLPRGTRMIITAHFDNSSKNKYNPDPGKSVRWGDPTRDEMMIGWLDYAVPNSAKRDATASVVSSLEAGQKKPAARQSVSRPSSQIFTEVAEQAGLDFQYYNGATGQLYLPEIMGSGAAFLDFDNDGDLDVFIVQGSVIDPKSSPDNTRFPWRGHGPPRARLYRNDLVTGKDGGKILKFTDVTEKSGILATGYGMGVAVGDINNDGWTDVYICNLGSNQMFLNNGNGTFNDVSKKTHTDDPRWSSSAGFFDYDRDGWLDLIVVNYVDFSIANSPTCYAKTSARDYCGPRAFRPVGNSLFHNKGDGTFEDVTTRAGVSKDFGRGLGVVAADFNVDGWIDAYVANDGDPNQLWINQKNGTFKNDALLAGVAVNREGQAEAGMGVDAGDFDGNGTEDIFVTHLMEETNTLFVNLGNGFFEDRTREAGLVLQAARFTGFGTLWFDYDNDGWLDLLVTNGSVRILEDLAHNKDSNPLDQPNQLFHNTGKASFVDSSSEAGEAFNRSAVGRGAAFGDIDNDGDTDVLISNNNGRASLFLNQVGNRNHWLGLRLVGDKVNRDMLGARVEIRVTKQNTLWRRVRTDGGYSSSQDPRVLAGLGNSDRVEAVRVYWPSGKAEEWRNPPVNRYITLKEGASPEIK
jgi:hypothetical protein